MSSHVVCQPLSLSDMATHCLALTKAGCVFNLILRTQGLIQKRGCFEKGNIDNRIKKRNCGAHFDCLCRGWLYEVSSRKPPSLTSCMSGDFLQKLGIDSISCLIVLILRDSEGRPGFKRFRKASLSSLLDTWKQEINNDISNTAKSRFH